MLYSQIILLIPHFFVKFSLFSVRVHCYRACEKLNSGHALKVIHVLASNLLVTGAFGPVRLTEKRPTYFFVSCDSFHALRITAVSGVASSSPKHSRFLSRATLVWFLASPPNGGLARRLTSWFYQTLYDLSFFSLTAALRKKIGFC